MKWLFAVVLGAAGLLLSTERAARAAEDGGTRSPFARGNGERGPGMGGAYVAVTDDASAIIWNPGGLGIVSRTSIEFGQTWLGEADANERYLCAAFPHWRWGTAALSFRRLGVGGVEQRDEADVPIPGELNLSESELAVGYGRGLGHGVQMGGALKLQRQVFGDLSASGLGADLGFRIDAGDLLGERVPWAAPFSVGLAVRNVLEPTLRLADDAIPDPRVLRAGLAWRHILSQGAQLTVGADLEHSSGLSTRGCTGAELDFGEFGSLRGGLNAAGVTAGMGLRWHGLSLDYAFEDRELGSIHRFGLSKKLGKSVDETRAAALQAEQDALDARLEQAFEVKKQQQLTDLLARADSARASGRMTDALEATTAAQAFAPGDSEVARRAAELWREEGARLASAGDPGRALAAYERALEARPGDTQAALGRERAQADLDRAIRHRAGAAIGIDSAYAAIGSSDLLRARAICNRLQTDGTHEPEILAALVRVEEVLGQRIAGRVERVRWDLDGDRLDAAGQGIADLAALGISESELSSLRQDLSRRAARKREQDQTPARAAPVVTPEQRREADQLYRRGLAVSASRPEEATRYWELARTLDPSHLGVRDALKRDYLLRGMEAFGRGHLEEADRMWSRVLELDPTDARARGYLERVRTQVERAHELNAPAGGQ